ncbi:MAG: NAD-dependent epimerase/dehydratase family protein [Bacteroidota bacterium]
MAVFLVTGGAGFIGSHLVERLLGRDQTVVCLDNLDPYYGPELKWRNLSSVSGHPQFTFVEGDIRDQQLLNNLFGRHRFDVVVHLAAKVGVYPSLTRADEFADVNVRGTLNVLEVMRKHHASGLIFASSSSVYGGSTNIPFVETDPVDRPISPYAATKRTGELLCALYHHLWNFNVACLRFFTVYGPRQRPEMAIHTFTRLLSEGERIQVFGDGSTARDYTYIDDILNGALKAIDNLRGFEIYNLGGSRRIQLRELIRLIGSSVGKKADVEHLPARAGEMPITEADLRKSREMLGYDPRVRIEEGLQRFVRWFLNDSRSVHDATERKASAS